MIELEGLEHGQRDEDAYSKLEEAPPKMRAKAELLARIACFMVKRKSMGWTKPQIFEAVRKVFGGKGTSDKTLYLVLRDIRGLDPVNFAPALLDDYNVQGRPCGPNWDDAWHYALSKIRDAHEEWPLDAAYDQIETIKIEMGWQLPSRAAFQRQWKSLPISVQLTLRLGADKARKMLHQPAMRNRDTITPNDIWSLDGRKLDIWAT